MTITNWSSLSEFAAKPRVYKSSNPHGGPEWRIRWGYSNTGKNTWADAFAFAVGVAPAPGYQYDPAVEFARREVDA